jgi:cytochrome c nitrite reductase small subunit
VPDIKSLNHKKALRRFGRTGLIFAGLLTGLGAFTFHYGEGASYFSKDPRSCMNCHIMKP